MLLIVFFVQGLYNSDRLRGKLCCAHGHPSTSEQESLGAIDSTARCSYFSLAVPTGWPVHTFW